MPGRQQKISFVEMRESGISGLFGLLRRLGLQQQHRRCGGVTGGCHPATRAGARAPTRKMPVVYLRYATCSCEKTVFFGRKNRVFRARKPCFRARKPGFRATKLGSFRNKTRPILTIFASAACEGERRKLRFVALVLTASALAASEGVHRVRARFA
jgi:hypothetical protein